mgnify:CR=1 FL=1
MDRLGRAADKDVCSVVVFAKDTLEEELYNFWNKGLNIFTQSLSGLEIIMNDTAAFNDLKEYLAEQQIGFREIYDGEQMTVQFTKR